MAGAPGQGRWCFASAEVSTGGDAEARAGGQMLRGGLRGCLRGGDRSRFGTTSRIGLVAGLLFTLVASDRAFAAAGDIVLYSSDFSVVRGNWTKQSVSGAAGSMQMTSSDYGWSSLASPQAAPANYIEATFAAQAGTQYRIWLRLRGAGNSKWNESVWVQFSDSYGTNGSAVHRIGTTGGLLVNLERCKDCGISGWGWQGGAYWLSQATVVQFSSSSTHTIRIQIREDGVAVDQVVLSPTAYRWSAPGQLINDTTIVPKTTTTSTSTTSTSTSSGGSLPTAPYSPNPPSGVTYLTTKPTLSWKSSGATSYELRLGTTNPPPTRVASLTSSYWYASTALAGGTRYYWQVVARNSAGSTTGPVWYFTTSGASTTSTTTSTTTTSTSTTGGNLRVLTWNIHHGRNTSNVISVNQQVAFMVSQNPDVIVLQEVSTWDNHQNIIPSLLRSTTGQNWVSVFAPSSPCLTGGGCIGELIVTRMPILSQSMIYLTPASAARAQISVHGVPVQFFSVHLEPYNTSLRTTQLLNFMSWARSYGGAQLVGGDFNSWWGEWWITQMRTEFYDTWRDMTGSNENGYTIGNVRFDYWFREIDSSARLTPIACRVPWTTLSDHRPVVADFRVQ
jgi:endonuclease/exonuclease/phosphatase family metal-dependent hydrolase